MTKKDITFSVLISSYNYQDFVVDAVNSAINQTYTPLEVIVVDDGSTDDSVSILKSRFGNNSRIKIISTPNKGQMSAWATGLSFSKGDVIALLDSDDLWKPEYLATIAGIYIQNPTMDYVYCNMEKFGAEAGLMLKKRRHKKSRDLGLSVLLGSCIQRWQGVATSGNTLKLELFKKILSLPESQIQQWKTRPDDCLFYGSDILGGHKYYLADALVLHREHTNNALQEFINSPIKTAQYAIRLEKMLDYYRTSIGFSPTWLKLAKNEFRTKPRPQFSELWIYCFMAIKAPTRLSSRLSQVGAIIAHYLKSKSQ